MWIVVFWVLQVATNIPYSLSIFIFRVDGIRNFYWCEKLTPHK
jgi:hypothetical protein